MLEQEYLELMNELKVKHEKLEADERELKVREAKYKIDMATVFGLVRAGDRLLQGIEPLPPPPPGYVTSKDLAARIQLPNQDPDDQKWGTVEDLKDQARASHIGDITPFLGPIRAIMLFLGGQKEARRCRPFLRTKYC